MIVPSSSRASASCKQLYGTTKENNELFCLRWRSVEILESLGRRETTIRLEKNSLFHRVILLLRFTSITANYSSNLVRSLLSASKPGPDWRVPRL